MTTDPSILSFILNAGIVVKLVILTLILTSIFSWMLIIQLFMLFKTTRKNMHTFYQSFLATPDLAELYHHHRALAPRNPLHAMFLSGFTEFNRVQHAKLPTEEALVTIERRMYITEQHNMNQLEENLGYLATIGSTSPYIGLFGTVWGIMTSFTALGGVQQATLAMVAPGISEALIATAFGLLAAIPAVIAYNRFSINLNRMQSQYEIFRQEVLTLLNHQFS